MLGTTSELIMMRLYQKTHTRFYHFSVDDVFTSFIEVSDRKISLFEHPFFQFLKQVHTEFGSNVHLYLFYQKILNGTIRTLRDVSDSIKAEFEGNRWLHLGPHALDYDTPPYTQSSEEQIEVFDAIYSEIGRFAGKSMLSEWVRLHHFSESYELASYFRGKSVVALLSTDKRPISYRIPKYARKRLRNMGTVDYEGIAFVRSHLRVENFVGSGFSKNNVYKETDSLLTRPGWAVVLTHEQALMRPEVRAMTVSLLRYLKSRGVGSL